LNLGQVVVIRQDQKIVSAFAVPADDLVGRRIAVAVDGVGVGVAFVPAEGLLFLRQGGGGAGAQRGKNDQNKCAADEGRVVVRFGHDGFSLLLFSRLWNLREGK